MADVDAYVVLRALGDRMNQLAFLTELTCEFLQALTCTRGSLCRAQVHSQSMLAQCRLQGSPTHQRKRTDRDRYRQCKVCYDHSVRKMT